MFNIKPEFSNAVLGCSVLFSSSFVTHSLCGNTPRELCESTVLLSLTDKDKKFAFYSTSRPTPTNCYRRALEHMNTLSGIFGNLQYLRIIDRLITDVKVVLFAVLKVSA